jgi:hypothetical protein
MKHAVLMTILALAVCVLFAEGCMSRHDDHPAGALPEELLGWRSAPDQGRHYDRETLYEYIDGGAELYLSYDFQGVEHRTYTHPGGAPDILVDVFDMGTSQNAFGVFSHSRETIEREFGQGSQYTDGLLLFWKGRYYVSILCSPEAEDSKRAVYELARRIDDAIHEGGPPPEIVGILPEEDLVEESIRYFHHYIWLNSHYYVSDENLLNIDESTEAVLATYGSGSSRRILLVVKYPDGEAAKAAYVSFSSSYLPELREGETARIEDGTWAGCRLRDRILAVVFDADSRGDALHLLDAVFVSSGS